MEAGDSSHHKAALGDQEEQKGGKKKAAAPAQNAKKRGERKAHVKLGGGGPMDETRLARSLKKSGS